MSVNNKWSVILATYSILLLAMGYIAFFHLEFNPVVNIGDAELQKLANPDSKELIQQALREESKAFQLKRDLAIQSFNIVLGAFLGFLSAAVVLKPDDKSIVLAPEALTNPVSSEQ
jgi:hypothetical protein